MQSAPSSRPFAVSSAVAFATMVALAGCSSKEMNVIVDSSPDGITIQYDTRYPTMAGVDADEHCAKYGKSAVRTETRKLSTMEEVADPYGAVGVFECVVSR